MIYIMSTLVKDLKAGVDFTTRSSEICGMSGIYYNDATKDLSFTVAHAGSTLDLKFVTHLNQDAKDESWGFRDLRITLKMCDSSCKRCSGPSDNQCLSCTCPKYLNNGYCVDTCSDGELCFDCEVDDTIISEFTEPSFSSYTGWTFPQNISSPIGTCGSLGSLFGGPQIFGWYFVASKSYSTPNPHFLAKITFTFVQVDSWDPTPFPQFTNRIDNDKVSFYLMNNLVRDLRAEDFVTRSTNLCGNSGALYYNDEVQSISSEIKHTSNTFDLKFVTHLNEEAVSESWGVRDIVITLKMCNPTCGSCFYSSRDSCESCVGVRFLYSVSCIEQYCLEVCPDGFWPEICTQTCRACHQDCKTCDSLGDHSCLSCETCDPMSTKNWFYGNDKTCSTACPQGTYISNQNDKICSKCHETCATCDGPGDHNCLTCDKCTVTTNNNWYYSNEKTCNTLCPDGTYSSNENTKICLKCHSDCQTCEGPGDHNCLSCDICGIETVKTWFYQKTCSLICPPGTFASGDSEKTCIKCHESCETCSGPGDHNCLSCDKCGISGEKTWLYLEEKICLTHCPLGTYPNEQKECLKCHESCDTCSGPGDHNCLTCDRCGIVTALVWYSENLKACFRACPAGTYPSNDNEKLCKICHTDCETCDGPGDHNCVTCEKCGIISEKSWYFQEEKTCNLECPVGSYVLNENKKSCEKCHENCETCSGAGDHNCLSCDICGVISNKLWYTSDERTCSSACPEGTYAADDSHKTCLKCHEDCESCFGPGDHRCITCDKCGVTSNKVWLNGQDNTCNPICPAGTYGSGDENKICSLCHDNCETCSGAGDHNCLTCDICGIVSDKKWYTSDERTCSSACPEGTYAADDSHKTCLKCHDDCETCFGPGDHRCITCDKCGVTSNKIWFNGQDNTCNPICPSGTYSTDDENKICSLCHKNCETCSGAGDHNCKSCDSCGVISNKIWYTSDEKTCSSICPEGTYPADDTHKTCFKCHDDCETCFGPGDHSCITCDKCRVTSNKIWFNGQDNTCNPICPPGTYVSDVENKICSVCNKNCKTCSGPGDHNCQSCDLCGVISNKIWYTSDEKTCSSACPFGTYAADDSHKTCLKCHEDCETCFGPGDHSCITCDKCGVTSNKVWLNGQDNTCNPICPSGTYSSDDENKICSVCHENCETCSGAGDHNCQSCDMCGLISNKIWYTSDEKTCSSTCPEGTYPADGTQKTCFKCHDDCETCFGPGDHSCTICDKCGVTSNKIWFNGQDNTCNPICPSGTYSSDDENKICSLCHENCETCSGAGDHNCQSCDSCGVISNKIWYTSDEKTCSSACPEGTYPADDTHKTCIKCHVDCETCFGPGDHSCITCDKCGVTSNKIWFNGQDNTCNPICPPGTYSTDDENKICSVCHENCETCSGAGDHNCQSCDSCGVISNKLWYTSEEKTCSSICPEGTYPADDTQKTCLKCHEDCETCFGPGDHSCITCDKCGFTSNKIWFNGQDNTCNPICPPGTYSTDDENKICSLCHESCETCSGAGDHNCQSCDSCGVISNKIWYTSDEKTCSLACPFGTYAADDNQKTCLKCHDDCESCYGPGDHSCITCDKCGVTSNKIWFNGQDNTCNPICPSGTYSTDDENKICSLCHENCETCSGAGDHNCQSCDSCGVISNKIWYTSNEKTCSSACPFGTYAADDSHKTCLKCHEDCETCFGPGDHNCITCDKCGLTSNKVWFNGQDNTCNPICPPGTYSTDDEIKICSLCHENCETCSGAGDHNCQSCDSCGVISNKIWYTNDEKTCSTTCPEGTYAADDIHKTCLKCHEDCESCFGPGDRSCITCDNCGVSINKIWFNPEENTCNAICPPGTYSSDVENKICSLCHESCKTCSALGDHSCDSCNSSGGTSLNIWHFIAEKACFPDCPGGTYRNDENHECARCHEDCVTCDGPGDHNCLSCDKCGVLSDKIWSFPHKKTCTTTCPSDSYSSDDVNKICSPCNEECNTCYGPLRTNCLSCDISKDNYKSYWSKTNTCTLHCPQGSYTDQPTYICSDCYTGCQNCNGPNLEDCLDCFANCILCPDENSCTKCSPNFYLYNALDSQAGIYEFCLSLSEATERRFLFKKDSDGSGISKDCGKNCLSCINETACLQCKNRNPFGTWIHKNI